MRGGGGPRRRHDNEQFNYDFSGHNSQSVSGKYFQGLLVLVVKQCDLNCGDVKILCKFKLYFSLLAHVGFPLSTLSLFQSIFKASPASYNCITASQFTIKTNVDARSFRVLHLFISASTFFAQLCASPNAKCATITTTSVGRTQTLRKHAQKQIKQIKQTNIK